MKFKKSAAKAEPETEESMETEAGLSIAELEKSTEEIEAEKERKKFAREERKFLKEHKKKREKLERFVAPILLLLTILISYLILTTSR